MTHFWLAGQLIVVNMDALWTPLQFTWDEQLHQVEDILDRWRIDQGWWRERVWREYFRLTTHTGLLAEIFHDLTTQYWYLQRLYD